ncbi:phosphopantetheine-binding protein, partial [Nocardia aurantia]|uniref:phosphopantetheine-binding protein n=1 Tax=Nocardia aurantia TaxID=2585199 RepID=UPI001298119E
TTVHVSHRVLDADTVAAATGSVVGRAIPGLRVYVLDDRLHPVPVGVAGEIYVAGPQLARGYLGRADLTAARFVAHPLGVPGERLYRAGDVARWNRHGELEYLGRADDQVKVRGFRIELGEIEAAVLAQPGVTHAAVIVREDTPGDQRIVAYIVPALDTAPAVPAARSNDRANPADIVNDPANPTQIAIDSPNPTGTGTRTDPANPAEAVGGSANPTGAVLDSETLRTRAAALLPAYMVPSAFVVLDAIPLTVNGKLDRHALPAPAVATSTFRAPETPVQQVVAEVFADILGVPRVGLDDEFFALGGNSLIATRVAARIGAALETTVAVRTLFEASDVESLAAQVESGLAGERESRPRLVAGPRPDRVPLSLAQSRMWFLNQFDTGSAVNNIPVAIRLSG